MFEYNNTCSTANKSKGDIFGTINAYMRFVSVNRYLKRYFTIFNYKFVHRTYIFKFKDLTCLNFNQNPKIG